MSVPVGFPGEQRKVSLIGFGELAASDKVLLICMGERERAVSTKR